MFMPKKCQTVAAILLMSCVCTGSLAVEPNAVPVGPQRQITNLSEVVVESVGPEGGRLSSQDGRVLLIIPPQAFDVSHEIRLATRDAVPQDGNVLSPVVVIETKPPVETPLANPAVLRIIHPFPDANDIQMVALIQTPGFTFDAADPNQPISLSYWKIAWTTRPDPNHMPTIRLTEFGTFAPAATPLDSNLIQIGNLASDDPNIAWADALIPPKIPQDHVHVGAVVLEDFVYQPRYSSVGLSRSDSPEDIISIERRVAMQDDGRQSDIIVAHVFTPQTSDMPARNYQNNQALTFMNPPDAPSGYVFSGVKATIDGVISQEHTTLQRDLRPSDIVYNQSTQAIYQGISENDISVQHVFEPAPLDANTLAGCELTEAELNQPGEQEGYEYIGVDVFINGQYSREISTVPFGRPHSQKDLVVSDVQLSYSDSKLFICIVDHIYAPTGDVDSSPSYEVAWEDLYPAAAHEGFGYVGRDIVIDGQWDREESTLSLDRIETPQDLAYVRTKTILPKTLTEKEVIIRHVFAPVEYTGCLVTPNPYYRTPAPPCRRYVGYWVVANKQLAAWSLPLDWPFNPTDLVYISADTVMKDDIILCSRVAYHIYEEMPCPPRVTTVTVNPKSYVTINEHPYGIRVSINFRSQEDISTEDREKLSALSVEPIAEGRGILIITVPLDTTVIQDLDQLTITLPDGYHQ